MKQINFNQTGGFPLEQETLKRLQTAYRQELFETLKDHLGIVPTKNYIISYPSSSTKDGWLIIHETVADFENAGNTTTLQGILYPFKYSSPTEYIKTTRTETSLVFGTGAENKVYADYEANYVDEAEYSPSTDNSVPGITHNYYKLEDFIKIDSIPELASKFLPLEGFVSMEGDLNLGNYKLSKLDTLKQTDANVRSQKINLGHPERRGLIYPNNYLGVAIEDGSDLTSTELKINPINNWENTSIGGKLKLTDIPLSNFDNTTLSLVIDGNGNVKKSNDLGVGVPLGTIALWHTAFIPSSIPFGWVECNADNNASTNGTVPDLSSLNLNASIKYMMYVGIGQIPTIDAGLDQTINLQQGQTSTGTVTLTGTTTAEVSSYEWTNNNGTVISTGTDELTLTNLAPGVHNYTFKVITATTNLTLVDTVKVIVISANSAPVINSISHSGNLVNAPIDLSFTSGSANLDLLANVQDLDGGNVMTYSCTKINGPTLGGQSPTTLELSSSTIGTKNVKITANDLVETTSNNPYVFSFKAIDTSGLFTERIITVNVEQTASISIISPIPSNPGSTQGYTVRVSARSNENVTLKADFSDSDFNNPDDFSYFVNGSMNVRKTNMLTVVLAGISCPPTSTNPLEEEFTVNVGPSGYIDLYCLLKANTYYVGDETNDGEFFDATLTTRLGIVNTTEEVFMSAYVDEFYCFDTESLVLMASGQSKKLKNVSIGDKLLGFDFPNSIDESKGDYFNWTGNLNEASKTEVQVVNKKTSVVSEYYEFLMDDNTVFKVTGEHPLLVTKDGIKVQWLRVKDIDQSMNLIDKNGKLKSILKLTFKNEPLEVATLDVEDVDNYVITGIVAHNKAQ